MGNNVTMPGWYIRASMTCHSTMVIPWGAEERCMTLAMDDERPSMVSVDGQERARL